MLPADQPYSSSAAGIQALRIASEYSTQLSSRVETPNSDGRKRRKIAPIAFAPGSWIRPQGLETAGPSHALAMEPTVAPDAWDFLAKWEAEDPTIIEDLPEEVEHYYSDMSEGSQDVMDEADLGLEEGGDSPAEPSTTRPSKLESVRITEIINDCIEMYTRAWKPGKDETKPKDEKGKRDIPVVYDPVALWEEAEATGQREDLAKKYDMEAEYYRQRLDKLCEEIFRDPGDTVASIKMKCRNLEVTVDMLERAEWLTLIYKEPPEEATDDDSQEELRASSTRTAPSTAQQVGATVPESSLSGIIDLGTPSDTSNSEDDVTLLNDMPVAPRRSNNKQAQIIQPRLLLSSDRCVAETIESPGPAMAVASTNSVRARALPGDAPEHASISTVRSWRWPHLVDTQDRKRIVSKAILELSSTDREMIRQRLQNVGRANVAREIPACVAMLLRGDKKLAGVLPQDLPKLVTLVRLFLCWWLSGNYFMEEASEERLDELASCLEQDSPDPVTFCDYLDTVLNTTFSVEALSKATQQLQTEVIEISDDD